MASVSSVETKRVFRQFQTFLNCLVGKMFLQNVAFEQANSNSLQRIFLIILYALQGCPWLSCHNSLQQRNGEGFKGAGSDVSYSGTPPKETLTHVLVLPSLPFIGMSVWERRNASTCRKVLISAGYQSLVNSYLQICTLKRHLTKRECTVNVTD